MVLAGVRGRTSFLFLSLYLGVQDTEIMFFIALGLLAIVGFAVMLMNYVERPTNNGGPSEAWGDGWREWNAPLPPENMRLTKKFLRWWE
jgi:peptidoglycan/LPS O-acetylase OafA/YrhL